MHMSMRLSTIMVFFCSVFFVLPVKADTVDISFQIGNVTTSTVPVSVSNVTHEFFHDGMRLLISWRDPVDSNFDSIEILRGIDSVPSSTSPRFVLLPKGRQKFEDGNLSYDHNYRYLIRAVNTLGAALGEGYVLSFHPEPYARSYAYTAFTSITQGIISIPAHPSQVYSPPPTPTVSMPTPVSAAPQMPNFPTIPISTPNIPTTTTTIPAQPSKVTLPENPCISDSQSIDCLDFIFKNLQPRDLKKMQLGSIGKNIVALQNFLELQGFLHIPPKIKKGKFGIMTRMALDKFQKKMKIRVIGRMNEETLQVIQKEVVKLQQSRNPQKIEKSKALNKTVINPQIDKLLVKDANGKNVIVLQNFLEGKGFAKFPEGMKKGVFGALTKKALMQYQKSIKVKPTGTLNTTTLKAINKELSQ